MTQPAAGPVPDELTVGGLLHRAAGEHGSSVGLVTDDDRVSFTELLDRSAVLARQLLASGIGKGGRVGLLFPNGSRFAIAWFAVARIGAVAVPLSTLATGPELVTVVRHADVELVLTADTFRSHDYVARWQEAIPELVAGPPFHLPAVPFLRRIWVWGAVVPAWATPVVLSGETGVSEQLLAAVEAQTTASDPVSIIYTSGSTGDPKGVVHSHGSFVRQARKQAEVRGFTPKDRVFTAMPFFWVGGLTVALLAGVHSGARLLLSDSNDPEVVLELLEREGLTFYLGWPHMARALGASPSFPGRDFHGVRGGHFFAALPTHLRPDDVTLLNDGLGMTETAGPHTDATMGQVPEALRGSFGPPATGMEHRIVDPHTGASLPDEESGELQVRGDTLMLGLHKRERHEFLDADGWYGTGDLACLRDGQLYFHGRLDDLIKTSGTNVSPREVEVAINGLPGVSGSFVTGVQDRDGQTRVGAVVFTGPGVELSADDVTLHARTLLSSYKVPRHVVVAAVERMPTTSSTKVDRRALVQLLEGAVEGGGDRRP